MQFLSLSTVLSLLPLALAQYGSPDSDPTTATTSAAQAQSTASASTSTVHKVNVGKDNALVFDPNSLTAAVGDKIEFHFFPPTHSVIESSFDKPCAPVNASAFFSGGFTTSTGENANVFTVEVNSTDPIWFYCGFPGHCEVGMVGVVNPPSGQTIEEYAAAAAKATSGKPPASAQGGVVGPASTPSSTSSSTPTSSGAAPTASGNVGSDTTGGIQWMMFVLTGVVAVGVGSLMV